MIISKDTIRIKPIVKWAGGKTQLLNDIIPMIPDNYNEYFELFSGGASLLFSLLPKKATLNDINQELIITYREVKKDFETLTKTLKSFYQEHSEEFYNQIRSMDRNTQWLDKTPLSKIAARFIYLNKTCFNGLYRVNSKNEFNVPQDKSKDASKINLNLENFKLMSDYFNTNEIKIENQDFEKFENKINKNDFVFIDPPYDSDDSKSFDSYTTYPFGKDGQNRLANFLKRLDKKGVKWIITNHNTQLINELYKNFNRKTVTVNRFINSKPENRIKAAEELIIWNYPLRKNGSRIKNFSNNLVIEQLGLKDNNWNLDNVDQYKKTFQMAAQKIDELVDWIAIKTKWENDEIRAAINDLNLLKATSEKQFNERYESLIKNSIRKNCLKLLPFLLTFRNESKNKLYFIDSNENSKMFDNLTDEEVRLFIIQSGLLNNIFLKSNINIEDYIFGVEVGLSTSNARKNKVGSYMQNQIKKIFIRNNISYETQDNSTKYNLTQVLEESKVFDFSFLIGSTRYFLECNFFNGGGSKIISEASRFKKIHKIFLDLDKYKFIWVSDGKYWLNSNLIADLIKIKDFFYNLYTFEQFLIKNKK